MLAVLAIDVVAAIVDFLAAAVIALYRLPWFQVHVVVDPATMALQAIGPVVTIAAVVESIRYWRRRDRPELVLVQQLYLVLFVVACTAVILTA